MQGEGEARRPSTIQREGEAWRPPTTGFPAREKVTHFPPPLRGRVRVGGPLSRNDSHAESQSTVKVGRKSSGASDDVRSNVSMLDSSITYSAGPTCFR
jgi:hypothetical protein